MPPLEGGRAGGDGVGPPRAARGVAPGAARFFGTRHPSFLTLTPMSRLTRVFVWAEWGCVQKNVWFVGGVSVRFPLFSRFFFVCAHPVPGPLRPALAAPASEHSASPSGCICVRPRSRPHTVSVSFFSFQVFCLGSFLSFLSFVCWPGRAPPPPPLQPPRPPGPAAGGGRPRRGCVGRLSSVWGGSFFFFRLSSIGVVGRRSFPLSFPFLVQPSSSYFHRHLPDEHSFGSSLRVSWLLPPWRVPSPPLSPYHTTSAASQHTQQLPAPACAPALWVCGQVCGWAGVFPGAAGTWHPPFPPPLPERTAFRHRHSKPMVTFFLIHDHSHQRAFA